jgi:hypothetical protein
MVLPFCVEAGLVLARLCWLEMYSRKFGLRLRGKFGNLLKTPLLRLPAWQAADYLDITDWRTVVGLGDMRNSDEIEVLREREFVSASSRMLQVRHDESVLWRTGSLRSPLG